MLRLIGKALTGLVLTKEAREAVDQLAAAKAALASSARAAIDAPPPGTPAVGPARPPVTPERAELIRQALQVRAAKQTLLADLDEESRAKLAAMAITAFLPQDRPKP